MKSITTITIITIFDIELNPDLVDDDDDDVDEIEGSNCCDDDDDDDDDEFPKETKISI